MVSPLYMSEPLTPYSSKRPLRSSHRHMLAVPHSWKKKARDRAFSVAAPQLWNSLLEAIRQAESVDAFKMHLKTHFYSLAFNCVLILEF